MPKTIIESEQATRERDLAAALFKASGAEVLEDLARGLISKGEATFRINELLVSTRDLARRTLARDRRHQVETAPEILDEHEAGVPA